MVVDELLQRVGASLKRHKSSTMVAEVEMHGRRAVLARPLSYMNDSGRPVAQLARWYKVSPERIVVVHDELDIPFGDVRIKSGGGTAGHNGLGSLVSHLGTQDFLRVRVGIGRPRETKGATTKVLGEFTAAERRALDDLVTRAADSVDRLLEVGAERAMNEVNTR
jgi:peptidyl-tRNA hydrolase, PTH1 family